MAGAVQVAAEHLAFKRGGRGDRTNSVDPAELVGRAVPALPRDGYGEVAEQVWEAFWRSPISLKVDLDADGYFLIEWLDAIDRRERLMVDADAEPVVVGSKGQDVPNPRYSIIAECERTIARVADHFGMTPLSRFRLRIVYSEAGQSEDKLARLLSRRREDVEDERVEDAAPVKGRIIEGQAREVEL